MTQHIVEIVRYKDGTVVKTFGPYESERKANKVDDALNTTLDHERFYTRIETA